MAARAPPGRSSSPPTKRRCGRLPTPSRLFAPEIEVLTLPAWDCLPYDRASPALRVMSERLSTLSALQRPIDKPQLLVVTANGATQRVLTRFRIRQLTRRIAQGADRPPGPDRAIDRTRLSARDTVAEHGEFAVRGSLIDLFPSGEPDALRLDFFGDEIESLRRFDPADQRSKGRAESFTLMPASEALLDEGNIKRFPGTVSRDVRRNRHRRPAVPGGVRRAADGGDGALAAFVRGPARHDLRLSWRKRCDGPRFRDRRGARFPLGEHRRLFREPGPGDAVGVGRLSPACPLTLYLEREEWDEAVAAGPIHRSSPFPEAEGPRTIDFEVESARDFAPERARNANVYEAVAGISRNFGEAAARSSWPAIPRALANGSRAFSKTMG
jgi:transcription-repair coupling factor (superfamily II helicase)